MSLSPKTTNGPQNPSFEGRVLSSFRFPGTWAPSLGNTVERDLKLPGGWVSEDPEWLPPQWRAQGALLPAVRAPSAPRPLVYSLNCRIPSAPQTGRAAALAIKATPTGCSARLRTRFPRGPGDPALRSGCPGSSPPHSPPPPFHALCVEPDPRNDRPNKQKLVPAARFQINRHAGRRQEAEVRVVGAVGR